LFDRAQNVKLPVNVPMPAEPGSTPPAPPKTLPHALSRAAKAGALNVGLEDRLGKTLNTYSEAMEKASRFYPPTKTGMLCAHADFHSGEMIQVGDARLQQDHVIVGTFLTPWQATLSSSIALAMKARANVKTARLELDAARSA